MYWILCTTYYPSTAGRYLVVVKGRYQGTVEIYYFDGEKFLSRKDEEVIKWQKLPDV